MGDGDARNM